MDKTWENKRGETLLSGVQRRCLLQKNEFHFAFELKEKNVLRRNGGGKKKRLGNCSTMQKLYRGNRTLLVEIR